MPRKAKKPAKKADFLLSTDSLSGYGLDLIFQLAKEQWYDWIDLAMWKNFDAWSTEYVEELVKKYKIPVKVIQISSKVNIKEMNQAVDLAKAVEAEVITINSPEIFNLKSYRFLTNHLPAYKKHNKAIKFSIINPKDATYLWLIPKFYFKNMVEIIRKYSMYLWLDIAHVSEDVLENQFIRKMANFIPYLSVVYLSDVDKHWHIHLPLGEGELKLPMILKKFKQFEYDNFFSLKIKLDKKVLADIWKVEVILKKCRVHYKEYYEDAKIG